MPRKKMTKAAKATSKSWVRAGKLFELVGDGNIADARSFIATDKEVFVPLLDGKADKRNKKVRTMINDYQKWLAKTK